MKIAEAEYDLEKLREEVQRREKRIAWQIMYQ
jgi:hypothetical protein